jgi:hypothetical protein
VHEKAPKEKLTIFPFLFSEGYPFPKRKRTRSLPRKSGWLAPIAKKKPRPKKLAQEKKKEKGEPPSSFFHPSPSPTRPSTLVQQCLLTGKPDFCSPPMATVCFPLPVPLAYPFIPPFARFNYVHVSQHRPIRLVVYSFIPPLFPRLVRVLLHPLCHGVCP